MTLIELALILVYTSVLVIKTCSTSAAVCTTYGFGDTATGEAHPQFVCPPLTILEAIPTLA